ncbi:MAG: ADP-dependent NAD(P)H-hydrate dehydratase / NAD(P)H-hydrate epimerase [Acidimicrobiaceae bacterium]|nr:ADP-dependent NAD(P)H-hydrate dehydratase / NAD(P)H-hydrate epimerase [Acidimicrobiaceae bacterium]
MIPVVTAEEMKAVDQAAPEPVEVLIGRAGRAVAIIALDLLGGAYGRRVIVVAGKGNNGADGRAAAAVLRARGVRVSIVDAASLGGGERLPPVDLVIDAAYGTGFRGTYAPPDPGDAPVLAVDIPSGIDGDTGVGDALAAVATVTFQAYKPGLVLGAGPTLCGHVVVADIGLGAQVDEVATAWLMTDLEAAWLAPRARESHKWQHAAMVVAGSPGMMGAPALVSRGAMRAGSGYVRLGVPGAALAELPTAEAVGVALPAAGWEAAAADAATRCRALVTGPGLGRSEETGASVAALLRQVEAPAIVDADGINALGSVDRLKDVAGGRAAATVITPHEGEYARLTGAAPGDDRLGAVRSVAARSGAVVLLKGSTTVVAAPDGRAWFVTTGSPRLATAGTGDVLSGVIGAFLASGVPGPEAAALAAHVHGRAAQLGPAVGLVAGDLPDLVSDWLSDHASGAS